MTGGGVFKNKNIVETTPYFKVIEEETKALGLGVSSLIWNYKGFYSFDWSTKWCSQLEWKDLNWLKRCIVANVGTGASIIELKKSEAKRVTGTAVGGGTFIGLCKLILKDEYDDVNQMIDAGLSGNLGHLSLWVKDVFGGNSPYKGLDEDIVVSSFSRTKSIGEYEGSKVRNIAFMVGVSIA